MNKMGVRVVVTPCAHPLPPLSLHLMVSGQQCISEPEFAKLSPLSNDLAHGPDPAVEPNHDAWAQQTIGWGCRMALPFFQPGLDAC